MKHQTRKHRFSILELISVVAVILTLMSVLISSIKTSKDVSIQVACMSNISQIRAYTELYRKDHKMVPYSDIWLTDFSYASAYMDGSEQELKAFICPGSDDAHLTSTEQLKYDTSYYYVPSHAVLEANIADGQKYGFDLLNIGSLAATNQLVIYDKSPDHHNGKVNTAYLYGNEDPGETKEGQITTEVADTYLALDGTGQLTLEDAATYGSLNINPANSSGNLFTLTDIDGNVIEIRDDNIGGTGKAVNITIKVKAQGRTLVIDDEEFTLKTNTTYEITATSTEESGTEDPFYIYQLTQDGNGNGQWWIDLFVGVGSITISDGAGNTTTLGNGNGNGNSSSSDTSTSDTSTSDSSTDTSTSNGNGNGKGNGKNK